MISDRFLGALSRYGLFSAGPEPCLVLEEFPDNPADSCGNGVANLGASLEAVFSRDKRHWMGVQRYDVRDPFQPHQFVQKAWVPVNSPRALPTRRSRDGCALVLRRHALQTTAAATCHVCELIGIDVPSRTL